LVQRSSPKSLRFGSSGLNHTSEGLLLGVRLRTIMEDTHSDPHQSGSRIPNIFDYAKRYAHRVL
jgi:hypothetical protein